MIGNCTKAQLINIMRILKIKNFHLAFPTVAMTLILAAGVPETQARQYVSLLPNYSNMKSNEPLDYWEFRQDADIHNISELWALPNGGMIQSASFSNCTFRYSGSDKVISYTPSFTLGANDSEGFMELRLALDAEGNSPWNVSRVEIYAVNAFNPDFNYKPSFTINGIRATLPPDNTRDYCGVDFPEDAAPLKTIRFETPVNSRISFWDMKIYLRGEPQLPEGYRYEPRRVYGESEVYTFPAVNIGTLQPWLDGRLQCSLLNDEGEIVVGSTTVVDSMFSFDASAIEEGSYHICYHMPDISEAGVDRCVPDVDDGLPFVVEPTLKGLIINGVEAGDYAHIPDETIDPTVSWEKATISGLRDGVEAYWKISLREESLPSERGEIGEYGPIPTDFSLYDPAVGVNLTGGDRLHIILQKNGVRSEEYVVPYDRNSDPTAVVGVTSESGCEKWYTVGGVEVDPSDVAPDTVLIRVEGDKESCKVIIR